MTESIKILHPAYLSYFILCLVLLALLSASFGLYYFAKARRLKHDNHVQAMIVRKIIHEIRDPLNGVLGYSEMLSSGYYGDMGFLQHEVVTDIIECGRKISGFIKGCNLFFLNKAGHLCFEWSKVSMKVLVEELIQAHQSRFDDNKTRVIINAKDEGLVMVDRGKLYAAFSAIIEYVCIKSKSQRDIKITIEVTRRYVHVLFVFLPGDNFSSKVDTLSISLCKMLVDMHKGELTLKTSVDGFANLRIALPKRKSV